MKKILASMMIAILFCCLTSCGGRSIYAMEQDAEVEAMEERYREGILKAQEQIASLVEIELWDLEFDIDDDWGISPEEAIQILTNYADGEPISEAELNKAIWAIRKYYYGVNEIVNGIDDYWID